MSLQSIRSKYKAMQTRTTLPVIISLFLLAAITTTIQGQSWRSSPWEFQAGVGSANYFGDIGGTAHEDNWYGVRDLDLFRSRLTGKAGVRYNHSQYFSFSGHAALGWLSGCDSGGRNETRGYVFNTIFFEPGARAEFYPFRDILGRRGLDRRGMVRNYATVSTYVWAGMGAIVYGVIPNDALEARRERDNIDHGFITGVIPAGVGIKMGIMNNVDIGLEIGGRWAFNDYLDGFTSPTAQSNDIYYVTTVNIVYRLQNLEMIGLGP